MTIFQIDAGPGSGKTHTNIISGGVVSNGLAIPKSATTEQRTIYTTLKQELSQIKSVVYFAHTNTLIDSMKKRLPTGTPIYTFHAAGASQLTRMYGFQRLDNFRTEKMIGEITGQNISRLPVNEKVEWYNIKFLVNKLKQEFLDPTDDNLAYLKIKYPELCLKRFPDDWKEKCNRLLMMCLIPPKKRDTGIEFIDMIYMAAKLIKAPTYDLGIVDEGQDMSASTYALTSRMCRNLVVSGDPNQAINAWMGADEKIWGRISEVSDAIFPMKHTFRLPPNIITRANHLIPNSVTPGTDKAPGIETNISYKEFIDKISDLEPIIPMSNGKFNTLTLCRTNAPLITLALALSQKGVAVTLADKDLPARLISHIKSIGIRSIDNIDGPIDSYLENMERRKNPLLLLMAQDFCESIRQMAANCNSLEMLKKKIKEICTPKQNQNCHLFATIHKGKGLEAPNCFIINPPIEHPLAQQNEIAAMQERFVHFVGLTRTSENIFWVNR